MLVIFPVRRAVTGARPMRPSTLCWRASAKFPLRRTFEELSQYCGANVERWLLCFFEPSGPFEVLPLCSTRFSQRDTEERRRRERFASCECVGFGRWCWTALLINFGWISKPSRRERRESLGARGMQWILPPRGTNVERSWRSQRATRLELLRWVGHQNGCASLRTLRHLSNRWRGSQDVKHVKQSILINLWIF